MYSRHQSKNYMHVLVPQQLVTDLFKPATPEIVRPSPGIRGVIATEVGEAIIIGLSVASNMATLICAKDQVYEFANRLLKGMKRSKISEAHLSIRSNGDETTVTIKTTDESVHVAECLRSLVNVLEENENSSR